MITMKTPDIFDLLSTYCKAQGKWGVCLWLGYDSDEPPEAFSAAVESDLPLWREYWKTIGDVAITAFTVGTVIFLCDTEEEMRSVYDKVRGDDGLPDDPTPGRFYACTYDPEGQMLTENT